MSATSLSRAPITALVMESVVVFLLAQPPIKAAMKTTKTGRPTAAVLIVLAPLCAFSWDLVVQCAPEHDPARALDHGAARQADQLLQLGADREMAAAGDPREAVGAPGQGEAAAAADQMDAVAGELREYPRPVPGGDVAAAGAALRAVVRVDHEH